MFQAAKCLLNLHLVELLVSGQLGGTFVKLSKESRQVGGVVLRGICRKQY